jgi:hypothetical protein
MDIYKNRILDTAQAIIDMANEIESLKHENSELRDRLIHAQSETLEAIQQNESKPEPRDIGHENVVSWVVRKSGELQVSPGIVWGLVMDLISKKSDDFCMDSDACPDPVESACDKVFETDAEIDHEPKYKVGDKIRVVKDIHNPNLNGGIYTIRTILNTILDSMGYLYEVRENIMLRFYESEIEPYPEPDADTDAEPFEFRMGDVVSITNKHHNSSIVGKTGVIEDIRTTHKFTISLKGFAYRFMPSELRLINRPK